MLADVVRRQDHLAPAGQRRDLGRAGALQHVDHVERLGDRGAADQQAVVAQDHRLVLAQVAHQALAFVQVQRDALIAVIRQPAVEFQRVLRQRQQSLGHRRDRDPGLGVRVHDAEQIRAGLVDRRVDGEAGGVHPARRHVAVLHDVAVQVDLHQVGRAHLVEQHAVLVDQEMVVRPGQAGADMGVDEIGPAMMRHQPVQRGQITADLPLLLRHAGQHHGSRGDVHSGSLAVERRG